VTITYALTALLASLQTAPRDSLLAEGIRLAPKQPAAALVRFEAVLASDSGDVAANWRAAIALNDVAQPLRARAERDRRDSLSERAERYARRAVRLAPGFAPALFSLGLVLGNRALTRGIKERIRMATEIRSLALRALAADSSHDGAHHLLGRWNYEVLTLSGVERFIAKHFLGGSVFREASWDEGRRHLERAVALDPTRLFHRLDLARLYVARDQPAAARAQLDRIRELPDRFAADTIYRREAVEMLAELKKPRQ
jgi:tetratricopeptide (TPR) repeat protein